MIEYDELPRTVKVAYRCSPYSLWVVLISVVVLLVIGPLMHHVGMGVLTFIVALSLSGASSVIIDDYRRHWCRTAIPPIAPWSYPVSGHRWS